MNFQEPPKGATEIKKASKANSPERALLYLKLAGAMIIVGFLLQIVGSLVQQSWVN